MARWKPLLLGSAVALCALLNSGVSAAAEPEHEARERYENAVKLYEEGAFDAALVELNRAAELRPSYKVYYNIGQVRFAMHDYAAAMDAYRQYLENGGDKIPNARREQVQKELNTLAQRVAKLTIETDVPAAEVYVDDALVGTTPLPAPLLVNAGIRRLAVRHPDYLPQSRRLNIAGGTQDRVAFALLNRGAVASTPAPVSPVLGTENKASGPSAPVTPVTPTRTEGRRAARDAASVPGGDSGSSAARRVPWLGWAISGALATGAAVTGALALSGNSSLAADREHLDVSPNQLDSKAARVRTLATVADGLAVAALVAGGVSLWFTLDLSSSPSARPSALQKAERTLRLGWGPAGLGMKGAF